MSKPASVRAGVDDHYFFWDLGSLLPVSVFILSYAIDFSRSTTSIPPWADRGPGAVNLSWLVESKLRGRMLAEIAKG